MNIEETLNDLIAKMYDFGYEYDNDKDGVLFANIEDDSELSFEDWDEVEKYINERIQKEMT